MPILDGAHLDFGVDVGIGVSGTDMVEVHVSSDDSTYFPMAELYSKTYGSSGSSYVWNSSFENKFRYVKFYLSSSTTWTISSAVYSLAQQ